VRRFSSSFLHPLERTARKRQIPRSPNPAERPILN
jgi:hypothetical protein